MVLPTKLSLFLADIISDHHDAIKKLVLDNEGVESITFELSEDPESVGTIITISYYPSKIGIRVILASLATKYPNYNIVKIRDRKALAKEKERRNLLITLAIRLF